MMYLTHSAIKERESHLGSTQFNNRINKVSNTDDLTEFCDIKTNLGAFKSHGLADLCRANLMDRVDSKFLIPIHQLPNILAQLDACYSVLEIDGSRVFTYENGYFDTPDLQFYFDHHNGRLNRYKVRQRHYVDSDTSFLEVKFKNNKKRTIKSRIKLSSSKLEPVMNSEFVHQQTKGKFKQLVLTQRSGYRRIALANELAGERLTIDFNLWFEQPNCDLTDIGKMRNRVSMSNFFIAELKQNKISKKSPFYQLMSAMQVFPQSFSKYCIGNSLLANGRLKSNRFKPTLNRITETNYSTNKAH